MDLLFKINLLKNFHEIFGLMFRTLIQLKSFLVRLCFVADADRVKYNLTVVTPKDNSPLINQRAVAGLEVIICQNTGRTHGDAVAI
jgi:hypothetical protein